MKLLEKGKQTKKVNLLYVLNARKIQELLLIIINLILMDVKTVIL